MHNNRLLRLGTLIFVLLSLTIACNFPRQGSPTPSGLDLVKTYAAQTIQVQLTLLATGLQSTSTPIPPGTTTASPPGATPSTPVGNTGTPSPSQGVCDQAGFDKDVTYPDNSVLSPGEEFTKTWRLSNTGTCSWNPNYAIVFDRGDSLGGPASGVLTSGTVAPGEMVDVSVSLKAPDEPGTYQGYWKLRNAAGEKFGLGEDRDKDFWVKIIVEPPSGITYDFNIQAKSATWIGSGGGSEAEVPFGGSDDDPNGVAKLKDDFVLENGKRSGVALVVGPKQTDDGKISGTFPAYTIKERDHFKAKLGFTGECDGGQVIFQFGIKEGENLQQIEEWKKVCDGGLIHPDIDLSSYKGRNVQFVLNVLADGSPLNDLVVWGSARIEREK